jgi:hypothetical protein
MKTVALFLSLVIATPAVAGNYRFSAPYGYAGYSPWGNNVLVFDSYGTVGVWQPWGSTQRVYYDNTGGYGWQPWPRYGVYNVHPAYTGPVYYQAPNVWGVVPGSYSGHYYVPTW